jgi:hypothetical protein
MELFQRFLNAYRQADKKLGGFLPGGGTGNPLSNVVKQINPSEVAAFYGANALNITHRQATKALKSRINSSPETTTLRQLPGLMDAASKRMASAGHPGAWSPFVPGYETGEVRGGRAGTKIDLQGGIADLFGGPAFSNVNPLMGVEEPTVYATTKTPGWVIAHELGHAVDAIKRPYDYALPREYDLTGGDKKLMKGVEKFLARDAIRTASPGALAVSAGSLKNNDDKSLLSAGFEGALGGLGANQQVLRKEIMADRFGIPIAKEAGVPWSTRGNALAKSTYVLGATTPGFAQGVIGELLNRGVNAFTGLAGAGMRAAQGDQLNQTEAALAKYGYNPGQHSMTPAGNEIKIGKRNEAEKALYNFINNLR